VKGEETIDELAGYRLRIVQPKSGYRFSLDPLLLCDFAAIRPGERAIDLGCGGAVIPLILARQAENAIITGVEFQRPMAELARRNVVLNGLDDRISIVDADIMELKQQLPASSFDLVVSNPPFRGRGTGRISPRTGRDLARHESTATLADFLAIAKYLVAPTGHICFIHHPSRLTELLNASAALKLTPQRLRMAHGKQSGAATMFLIELAKGRRGELHVAPPLFVRDEDGNYSGEVARIFGIRRITPSPS
jgi:tRNA1Val (adenine37-N6)-methyltransferase